MPEPFFIEEVKVAVDNSGAQIGIITRVIARVDFLDVIIAGMRQLRDFVVPKRDQQESI